MTILRLAYDDWCRALRAGNKVENLIRLGLMGSTTEKSDIKFSLTVPAKVGAHIEEKSPSLQVWGSFLLCGLSL
jgi:hypothetical protein